MQDLLAEPLLTACLGIAKRGRDGSVLCGNHGIEYEALNRQSAARLVAAQMQSAGIDPGDGTHAAAAPSPRRLSDAEIVEILTMLSCDDNHTLAIRALCWLRYMEKEGRSLDAIGAEYGVCRATVQAIDKAVKERWAERGVILTSRADKSPEARAACRLRRLGKRKPKKPWKGNTEWHHPRPIPLS